MMGARGCGTKLGRWWPPLIVTAVILALGPGGSYVTRWGRAMPRVAVPLLSGLFGLAVLALLAWVLRRWRRDRVRRLGWVVAALGLVALEQLAQSDRGSALERTVERMHLLLFGALSVTTWLASRGGADDRERPAGGGGAAALALIVAAWVALIDELVQDALMARTGEVFDVGLNVFAATVGVVAAAGLFPMRWRGSVRSRVAALLLLAAPLPILLAAFLDLAHLGTRIEAEGLGAFHSFYSRPALERANRARRERWARRLPVQPPFAWWVVQDDFLVEGGWHVQTRNRALAEGELETVWIENTILERFYSAMLESAFPEESHPYRLKPWDLDRLATAGPFDPRPAVGADGLVSHADRGRIWIAPSPTQAWSVAAALTLVLGAAAWWVRRSSGPHTAARSSRAVVTGSPRPSPRPDGR